MNGLTKLPVSRISAFVLRGRPGSRLARQRSVLLPQIRPRPALTFTFTRLR